MKKWDPGARSVNGAVLYRCPKLKFHFAPRAKVKRLLRDLNPTAKRIIQIRAAGYQVLILFSSLRIIHPCSSIRIDYFTFEKKKMESIFEWFIGSSPSPAVKEEVVGTNTSGTKRRKMADLRAFVETRLLSRSDKMLEKIDLKNTANNNRCLLAAPDTVRAFIICKWNDLIFRNVFCFSLPFLFHLFTKSSFKKSMLMSHLLQEEKYPSKTSLDAETKIPPRPLSALAHSRDDAARSYLLMQEPSTLVKGKSMPSLR